MKPNPLAALVALLILFALVLPIRARTASTYYLSLATNSPAGSDSNNCLSIITPCATYARVASMAVPGDTIDVRGGTYNSSWDNGGTECPRCTAGTNLTEGSGAITVKAHAGETVIVRENTISRPYWRYIGINVDSNDVYAGVLVTTSYIYYGGVDDAHRVEIRRSKWQGFFTQNYDPPNETKGIHLQYFYIHDNGNRSPQPHVPLHGSYWESGYGVIEDGEFADNETYGIQFYNNTNLGHPSGNILRRVTFHGNSRGVTCAANAVDVQIYNNTFYNQTLSDVDIQTTTNCQVLNNTISGSASFGIQVVGSTSPVIKDNIIYGHSSTDLKIWSASNAVIANNLTGNAIDDGGNLTVLTGNQIGDPKFIISTASFNPGANTTSPVAIPASPAAIPVSPAAIPASPAAIPASPAAIPVSPAAIPVSPAAIPASVIDSVSPGVTINLRPHQ